MRGMGRALVAEFLGTFALCFIGAGAICTNEWIGGGVTLLGIAVAHGAVLGIMISALGHISGGHFNPAVTIGLLSAEKIDSKKALSYIVSQLAGATVAGMLLRFIFPASIWHAVHLGTPTLRPDMMTLEGTVLEGILTFFLVLTVFGTAVDPKGSWNAIAGLGIGGVLIFDILVGGPLTGAAMNPARAFGPALASGSWEHHLVYWAGPLLGGAIAGVLYHNVFLESKKR